LNEFKSKFTREKEKRKISTYKRRKISTYKRTKSAGREGSLRLHAPNFFVVVNIASEHEIKPIEQVTEAN